MKPHRIEALADGIFAIVMTLLVLDLKSSELAAAIGTSELTHALAGLWPKFSSYFVSFFILGIYWVYHHILFTLVKRSDYWFLWTNILFLFFISLVPFSASFLGSSPFEPIAQIIYAGNLSLCALAAYGNWKYASDGERLLDEGRVTDELRHNVRNKILLPMACYLLGIAVSTFSPQASLVLLALGPASYFIPIDSHLWDFITRPKHKRESGL